MNYKFTSEKFDKTDKKSIYEYAKKMINMTFREIIEKNLEDSFELLEEETSIFSDWNRKGGLGDLVEKHHFNRKLDNSPEPDFKDAGLELKVSPYKINKNKTLSAKERLVLSMINYFEIVDEDFYTSSAWKKLENILIVYYLWDPEILDKLDYIIKFIYLYRPSDEDLIIIENDFLKIKNKVVEGKAHELSESDTLYLGAVTKASDSKKLTTQPFSDIPAKPRAFSLKNSYMTYMLRNYISKKPIKYESIIKGEKVSDFEHFIMQKINRFVGENEKQLFSKFLEEKALNAKNKYQLLVYRMLGVKDRYVEEFEKANIIVKTIREEKNGSIRESMSFPSFKIKDFIHESWEDSEVYNFFTETKFLFVVFKKSNFGYVLKGAKFWNMPANDIDGDLFNEWNLSQTIFKEGVKLTLTNKNNNVRVENNLPKLNNTNILHVRPHASKAVYKIDGTIYGNGILIRDGDQLPNGDYMTKQCFWLNNKYIKNIIKNI